MSNVFIGCAIWGYRPWVGDWLPAGTSAGEMLHAYAERLTTVEINATFYAVPDAATVTRWANDAPPTFRFCPKLPRAISHGGQLAATAAATTTFIARMQGLGERLGPLFLQLPPAYGPQHRADLTQWLARWPREVALAVEVRHRGWFAPNTNAALNALLAAHGVGRVLVDVRPINSGATSDPLILDARRKKPNVPHHTDQTAPFVLLRFMGHPDLALDRPLLAEWAQQIAAWLADGTAVYAFMHCPQEERSPDMCLLLAQQLAALGVPYPLPTPAAPPEQMLLF